VRKAEVIDYYRARRNRRAVRIVERIGADADGNLDPGEVDGILLRAHAEIQRLSEEFLQARRLHDLLAPMISALRRSGVEPPYRVVDIGCGTGFALRWLAMFGELGDDVELIGADYNAALVDEARGLARAEGLRCRFEVKNALELDRQSHIFFSIGVIHHFRGDDLETFFAEQRTAGAHAFLHFDIKASWLAPIGAWIFHIARMNEPLAQHDGVLSACRAHPSHELLRAAQSGTGDWSVGLWDEDHSPVPIFRVMHAIVAMRPELPVALERALGPRAHRLELATR
jgi:SAM-dependent methyltransferase